MCIQPGAVTPDDLIAYTDDEASPSVIAHLRACPRCAADADAYARQQRRLRRRLARFACPSPQMLTDFEFGLLASSTQREVAGHLAECPRCRDELATMRTFLDGEAAPVPAGAGARIRRVVAALLAPRAGQALGQLRGSEAAAPQVFAAGEIRITVSAEPATAGSPTCDVVGLIWREGDGDASVAGIACLIGGDGERRTTGIDELGNFGFDAVERGVYGLEVVIADDLVVVHSLPIGG